MFHKTGSVATAYISFKVVCISMEDIHLKKREVHGFLKPTDINSNNLIVETVYETVFENESHKFDAGDNPFDQYETNIQEKKFITSPGDIDIHHKVR